MRLFSSGTSPFARKVRIVAAEQFDMGAVGLICALGHLDFRFPDIAWRSRAPSLNAWAASLASRPSVADSVPIEG